MNSPIMILKQYEGPWTLVTFKITVKHANIGTASKHIQMQNTVIKLKNLLNFHQRHKKTDIEAAD